MTLIKTLKKKGINTLTSTGAQAFSGAYNFGKKEIELKKNNPAKPIQKHISLEFI